MRKVRSSLSTIVLLATLGVSLLSGMGLAAGVTFSRYAGASFAAGHAAGSVAFAKPYPNCPGGLDC